MESEMSESRSISVARRPVVRYGRCMGCHGSEAKYVYAITLHGREVRICESCIVIIIKGIDEGGIRVVDD